MHLHLSEDAKAYVEDAIYLLSVIYLGVYGIGVIVVNT